MKIRIWSRMGARVKVRVRKRLSTPWIAAIGAAALIGVLFLTYMFSSGPFREKSTGIVLPEEAENAPLMSAGSELLTIQRVAEVEINTDNAKRVVASLTRPEAYSCKIENILYYEGGETVLHCRQYIQGDAERVDTMDAYDSVKSTLLRVRNTAYSWNAGDFRAYKGIWGDFNGDAAAMLPTYEDVLGESIKLLEAERQDLEFEPCMRMVFELEGYKCEYHISLATGLLKSAAFRSGDKLVREVKVKSLDIDKPDRDVFSLPTGENILGD